MQFLLFDFDDTLISYDASETYGLQKALEEHGIPAEQRLFDIYREENRKLWRLIESGEITSDELRVRRFEKLIEIGGITTDVAAEVFSETYLKHFSESKQLEDGARELLEYLHRHPQFTKAIITNGFKDTQRRRLGVTEVEHYFNHIFISDELGAKKPDPLIFERVMERLGNPSADTVLIIGDNLVSDIMGGKQSGLRTCWYNPKRVEASEYSGFIDYQIQHLSELPGLLGL
ncbi:MAG: YjjG family noncanonical pyrimidine nucleotidase [Spirochaetota bacterium]